MARVLAFHLYMAKIAKINNLKEEGHILPYDFREFIPSFSGPVATGKMSIMKESNRRGKQLV